MAPHNVIVAQPGLWQPRPGNGYMADIARARLGEVLDHDKGATAIPRTVVIARRCCSRTASVGHLEELVKVATSRHNTGDTVRAADVKGQSDST